ncbi:restriction endonuclease [Ottowia thiooxydans]|uniref:restriction endonuclease n=1 Tax=Ottowia thiooxydans TaxID=219182 RepID=UPI000429F21A|nr:restriction endonuclease [Ottowia thiooxydans]
MRSNFFFSALEDHSRPPFQIGRETEADTLTSSILQDRSKIVAITGPNATGKTLLWMHFLKTKGIALAEHTEVISLNWPSSAIPSVGRTTKLVVIEDLSYDFTQELTGHISSLLQNHSDKQFILVGASANFIEKFSPNTHIRLGALSHAGSQQLLLAAFESMLSDVDIAKVTEFAKGSPYLMNLVATRLNRRDENIDSVLTSLTEDLRYKSIFHELKTDKNAQQIIQVESDIRVINGRLLEAIQRDSNAIHALTPRQFEEFVAELMEKRGYKVDLTKATRDGGKDLIIANNLDIGNFIYYVECKKYSPTNPVGVNLVRELAGTVLTDRVTAGIMVTSSYFSPDAIKFSNQIKHQLSLIDYIKLKEWINKCGQ